MASTPDPEASEPVPAGETPEVVTPDVEAPAVPAQPAVAAQPTVEAKPGKGFRAHHTLVQWLMLGVNVIVIVACFVGAGALLIGKNLRESLTAAPLVSIKTTLPPGSSTPPATEPTVPPSTQPDDTAPVETSPPETFPAVDSTAENFLITGDDNDACVDPGSPWAGAVEDRPAGNRSDTIMVMRIDPTTKAAAVLSFPRDLYVKVPGKGTTRINNAYQQGQYDIMAQTLYDNFGVSVDHFIQIDLCAFKRIVDAVGGVSVPFVAPIRDTHVGLDIPEPGCHAFTGDEALAYVRTRKLQYFEDGEWKSDGTSDYGRITRQQDFLRRMLKAALDKGLFNPSVARGILEAARDYVVFDQGFSLDDMLSFAGLIRDIPPATINTYQVQAVGKNVGGAAVLIPTLTTDTMKAILAVFRGEVPLAAAPSEVDVTTVSSPDTTATAAATTVPTATSVVTSSTAVPSTNIGAGPVPSTVPGASTSTSTVAPATTTTTLATTTTPITEAPVVTNPESITKGYFPDKNVEC